MNNESKSVQLSMSLAEVNQILEALGNQPYVRVFQLIGKIQQQVEGQPSDRSLTHEMVPIENKNDLNGLQIGGD